MASQDQEQQPGSGGSHDHGHGHHHHRPHLRSHNSRGSHRSEDRSQPYANNDAYIPGMLSGIPVAETALLAADEPESPPPRYRSRSDSSSRSPRKHRKSASRSPHRSRSRPVGRSVDEQEESQEDGNAPDRDQSWDNMRDGSISRRPAWQRPSPRWVLPFVLGVTVSVGMTIAPRAELYTDLACLAHPPRVPDTASPAVFTELAVNGGDVHINTTDPVVLPPGGPLPMPDQPVMSPGDKWFERAQKDIYKYLHPTLPDETEPIPLPSDPSPGSGSGKSKHPKLPNAPSPFPEIDPALCKSDGDVQRVATRLTMVLSMTGGAVSALTTGYWAGKSDRIGRRKILSLLELGFLVNDASFLFITSHPAMIARFSLYIVLIGPFLEGLVGGLATLMATMHAYISDVTPDGSRATHFGRLFGMLMAGFAVGPFLGTALISATGNILSPFYVTVAVHAIFATLLRFALPESLSSESRFHLKKRAYAARDAARERDAADREWEHEGDDEPVAGDSGFSRITTPMRKYRTTRKAAGVARRSIRNAFSFLEPLQVFIPKRDESGRINYNLFIVAVMHAITSCMMGVQQMKALYTQKAFGWTPAELGPFMSFMGAMRLIVLMILTPLLMYFIKPYFTEPAVIVAQSSDPDASPWSATRSASPRAEINETSPLLEPRTLARRQSTSSSTSSLSPAPSAAPAKPKRSAQLDLYVLRGCLIIESTGWLALGFNSYRSSLLFLAGSAYMTFGAPASPAANSLILAFAPNKQEVGRLFGAMGVLHALGSAICAPLIFGNIYFATVDSYAPTMFLVAGVMLVFELAVSAFIRVPKAEEEARGRGRGRSAA